MIRVVADTNILVSATFWKGKPYQIVKLASEGRIALFSSDVLFSELKEILIRDFPIDDENCQVILDYMRKFIVIVKPELEINTILKDPDDNRVLECAMKAKADFIVSGDRHILELLEFEGIKICNADGFLKLIAENH